MSTRAGGEELERLRWAGQSSRGAERSLAGSGLAWLLHLNVPRFDFFFRQLSMLVSVHFTKRSKHNVKTMYTDKKNPGARGGRR